VNRVERHIGAPAMFEELAHAPGSALTLRARGPRGSAIVKLYRADRVAAVAERIEALAGGPREPVVPTVLEVDAAAGLLLLTDVQGAPLREAALASDEEACRRTGSALGTWHAAWRERAPDGLPAHTVSTELASLVDQASDATRAIRMRMREALRELDEEWLPLTVVHRRLHEEAVLVGERIGLIDLDDAGAGPPELDIGGLLAHFDLLALRSGRELEDVELALLEGYRAHGVLDPGLLDRCRRLTRLRLACVHRDRRLLEPLPERLPAATKGG
jgi:Ser/Thr protein kinase RdoA (MazF antagonist)